MSSFPNIPPASSGGNATPAAPAAPPKTPQTPPAAPAPPVAPPSGGEKTQHAPFIASLGMQAGEAQEGSFQTDQQFLDEFLRESYKVPAVVLVLSILACLGIFAAKGYYAETPDGYIVGPVGIIGGCVGAVMAIALGTITATLAGWIVSKMFGEDYGSLGGLVLRFAGVAAAGLAVFQGLAFAIGTFPALFIGFPLQIGVVMLVAGFDVMRAIVFNVLFTLFTWVLVAFLLMSVGAALLA